MDGVLPRHTLLFFAAAPSERTLPAVHQEMDEFNKWLGMHLTRMSRPPPPLTRSLLSWEWQSTVHGSEPVNKDTLTSKAHKTALLLLVRSFVPVDAIIIIILGLYNKIAGIFALVPPLLPHPLLLCHSPVCLAIKVKRIFTRGGGRTPLPPSIPRHVAMS